MKKRRNIKAKVESIERSLANAEQYLARNENVEGSAWLHTDDWHGKSGHPLWMKNFMIPALERARIRKEKALATIDNKTREKLKKRRRRKSRSSTV